MECCQHADTIISGRFAMVQVANIVMVVYLMLFVLNLQYMAKVVKKYNIRFLNHKGDVKYLVLLLLSVAVLVCSYMYFPSYALESGPVSLDFPRVVP